MLLQGDARALPLADASVQCVVTSPPYWGLRDYGGWLQMVLWGTMADFPRGRRVNARRHWLQLATRAARQGWLTRGRSHIGALGLESTPELYVEHMVDVFREVRRVLRPDGTLWLNLGDSYAGSWGAQGRTGQMADRSVVSARQIAEHPQFGSRTGARGIGGGLGLKPKDLVMMPFEVARALRIDGWWVRSDIVWSKPNPMPESVTDRPTKAHEYVFLLAKSERYFYDADAIREPVSPNWKPGGGAPVPELGDHRRADGARGHQAKRVYDTPKGRNARTVWTIATQPTGAWKRTARQRPGESDESSDGMTRTASPTCPVHGSEDRSDSSDRGDGRGAASETSNARTDDHHALAQRRDSAPTDPIGDAATRGESSDSPPRERAHSATDRSNGSRRTDRADRTFPHGKPSDESLARTGSNGLLPGFAEPHHDTPASRTSEGSAAHAPGTADARTAWNNYHKCTCSWVDDTGTSAHFATYPEKLVEPCILAGSSPKACGVCAAPWERVAEGGGADMDARYERGEPSRHGLAGAAASGASDVGGFTRSTITTGWRSTCEHDDDSGSCLVLDPFAGSGTTLRVATRLGRQAVGVDINREYLVEQATKRTTDIQIGLEAVGL